MHPIIAAALADDHREELLRRAVRAQRARIAHEAASGDHATSGHDAPRPVRRSTRRAVWARG